MLSKLVKIIEMHRPLYNDPLEGVCTCGYIFGTVMPGGSTWLGFSEHLALEIESALDIRPKTPVEHGRAF